MNGLKISTRLSLLIGVLALLTLVVAAVGTWGTQRSNEALKSVYEDRAVPLAQLANIQHHQLLSQEAIARALIDGQSEALSLAADQVEANSATVSKVWDAYAATYMTPEEKQLARQFVETRARYREQAVKPIVAALRANDLAEVKRIDAELLDQL